MNEKAAALLERIRQTALQAGDAAADAAYGAGRAAEEWLQTARAGVRILDLKAAVNTALREVGEILYATHIGHPSDSEVLLEKLREIDALKAELDALQGGKPRAEQVCPACGARVREGDCFCGACGGKL